MKCHEICLVYPDMTPEEFECLKQDIASNGLQEAITVLEGKILDGRHRHRACEELGIKPELKEYEGTDPATFVFSKHNRRNLNPSQKAVIASRLANMKHGGNRKNQGVVRPLEEITIAKAAEMQGVSPTLVKCANRVLKKRPDAEKSIMNGKTTVNQVNEEIRIEEQVDAMQAEREERDNYKAKGHAGKLPKGEQAKFDAQLAADKAAVLALEKQAELAELYAAHETLKNTLPDINEILDGILAAGELCGADAVKKAIHKNTTELMRIQAKLAKLISMTHDEEKLDE